MTLLEAIDIRISRRKYLDVPVDEAAAQKISGWIAQYKKDGGVDFRLVLNDGAAFDGFLKSYGMLSGVKNYVGLIADGKDKHSQEKIGYYGELLVLNMTAIGLGTCWVGGSFDRKSCPFVLSDSEKIACTVAFGYVDDNLGKKENFIRNMTHRKSKTVNDMLISDDPALPEWLLDGMRAVEKAPSAVNRQPVKFSYQKGVVTAGVDNFDGDGFAADLGIAKAHFDIAAGGRFGFGNNAEFVKNK